MTSNLKKKLFFIFLFIIVFCQIFFRKYKWTPRIVLTEIQQFNFPTTNNFTSLKKSSSAWHSVASLEQPKAQYCVGDTLNVQVEMRDYEGSPKAQGGDFMLARIHSPELNASASGDVTDLLNGSYHVRFHLSWPGDVRVSVLLIHSSEKVGILRRSKTQNYGKIEYTGFFASGNKRKESVCGLWLKTDKALCEYRKKEEGEYYACVQPQTLPCSSLQSMDSRSAPPTYLTQDETRLLARTDSGRQIKNYFAPVKVINCSVQAHRPTKKCVAGMKSPFPGGYLFSNRWSSSLCQTGRFLGAGAINGCLQGKRLYLLGDSTVRQWIEYLEMKLKDLTYVPPVDLRTSMMAVDPRRNITVLWRKHSIPFIVAFKINLNKLVYISNELDRIEVGEGRPDVVVVIGVGQHFRPFPLELFIQRLITIRQAILRLQARSPQALVIIKLENTRELTKNIPIFSNWYGHIQNLAQRKVFADLKVALVDAWDISVAVNTFDLHPNHIVVSNEIAVALSHLCHSPNSV